MPFTVLHFKAPAYVSMSSSAHAKSSQALYYSCMHLESWCICDVGWSVVCTEACRSAQSQASWQQSRLALETPCRPSWCGSCLTTVQRCLLLISRHWRQRLHSLHPPVCRGSFRLELYQKLCPLLRRVCFWPASRCQQRLLLLLGNRVCAATQLLWRIHFHAV